MHRRMLNEGYTPNATTYNALISAYGKAGQLDKVMEVRAVADACHLLVDPPSHVCGMLCELHRHIDGWTQPASVASDAGRFQYHLHVSAADATVSQLPSCSAHAV